MNLLLAHFVKSNLWDNLGFLTAGHRSFVPDFHHQHGAGDYKSDGISDDDRRVVYQDTIDQPQQNAGADDDIHRQRDIMR